MRALANKLFTSDALHPAVAAPWGSHPLRHTSHHPSSVHPRPTQLTAEKQRNIAEQLDRTPGEVLKKLEDIRNRVI